MGHEVFGVIQNLEKQMIFYLTEDVIDYGKTIYR